MVDKKEAEQKAERLKTKTCDAINEWCADYGELFGENDCLGCPLSDLCAAADRKD